jgi:hypothetical protein
VLRIVIFWNGLDPYYHLPGRRTRLHAYAKHYGKGTHSGTGKSETRELISQGKSVDMLIVYGKVMS